MKSFIRWAGSKTQILPEIEKYWSTKFNRYVEPFCGSASLFFSIKPKRALLSDLNEELVCTLCQVQTSVDIVIECLGRMNTSEVSYYKFRANDPSELSPNERAARFIYLNTLCFNGLYRTNRMGQFNVPFGNRTRKRVIDRDRLISASILLQNATLQNSDFEAVINQTNEGDFLYLDPPYATSSKKIFTEYGSSVFTPQDIDRLTSSLNSAADRGVKFVLSYANVPEILPLRSMWKTVDVVARRNIAGFSGARKSAQEVLITNCD